MIYFNCLPYLFYNVVLMFNSDCGRLFAPVHGFVDNEDKTTSSMYQAFAVFTCKDGYRLAGVSERQCESSGRWSGSGNPSCVPLGE